MELVKRRGGRVIRPAEDVFQELEVECSKGHKFHILENDLQLGEWCKECQDPIGDHLQGLQLVFFRNERIGDITYPYLIKKGDSRVAVVTQIEGRMDAIKNAREKGHQILVIDDGGIPKLKEKIWRAVKGEEDIHLKIEGDRKEESVEWREEKLGGGDLEESVVKRNLLEGGNWKKRVLGYIRVSTVMQVQDGFSLEAQESKIVAKTESLNGHLHAVYIDRGISGGSIEGRKGLEKCLGEVTSGDWIIVNSVSRLARNTKDLLEMTDLITKKGAHLMILDLDLDITSPSGKLILTLIGSQAQFEREITSERVKGVMAHLKKTGTLRTKPPFGWKMNPDHSSDAPIHIRDEEEQLIIERIRRLRSEYQEMPITTFSHLINSRGVPPPRKSKTWYHKSVSELLKREGMK